MTNRLSDIGRLLPVLEIAFQAEQLKMSKIAIRITNLQQKMRDLDKPVRVEPLSAATLAGADLRWDAWANDRKRLINQELVLALRDRENAKGKMIIALSKLEAAKQMQKRAKNEADYASKNRASW